MNKRLFSNAKWNIFAITMLLFAVIIFVPGANAKDVELSENQILHYGLPAGDIKAFDPAMASTTSEYVANAAIYEALIMPTNGTLDMENLQPSLATSWESSDDYKVWTFKLRKGVQWQKGYGEFTAEDVKFTIERMQNPKLAAVERSAWEGLKVEIIDKYTVKIISEEPRPFFLLKLIPYATSYIVCKAAAEDEIGSNFRSNPVGTGPFQLDEYKPKDRIIFKPNKSYWGRTPYLKELVFHFMPSLSSRTLALEKGELDATYLGRREEIINSLQKKGYIVDIYEEPYQAAAYLNLKKIEIFRNLKVRQALAYAIKKEEYCTFYGSSVCEPLYSPIPTPAFGALTKNQIPKELLYEYNPEKAKQLLKEAGYPNGFELNVILTTRGFIEGFLQVQEWWRKIGVNMNITRIDHAAYHQQIRQDLSDVVCFQEPQPPHADRFLNAYYHSKAEVMSPTANKNFSHYGTMDITGDGKIDSIDNFVKRAAESKSLEEQLELYREAQLQILRDLPTIPLCKLRRALVRQPYVDIGFEIKGQMQQGYKFTELTRLLKH